MKQRLIEIGKNVLIVLLSCSLLFLTLSAIPSHSIRTNPRLAGLLQPIAPLLGLPEAEVTQVAEAAPVLDAAQPIAISVMNDAGRCSAMWNFDALDTAFERFAPHLGLALSEATQFTRVSQEQVQIALAENSVYLRYAKPLPASLLAFWLDSTLEAAVGNVGACILSASEDTVRLYLLGAVNYCAETSISSNDLHDHLQTYTPDGSVFAFETEYSLAPLSLLPGRAPAVPAVTASNPCDSRYINALATAMGFNPYGEGRYTDDRGDTVFSETNASLEITAGGRVTYRSENPRFAADSTQPEVLTETARQLTDLIFSDIPGEGRLYLTAFEQTEESTICRFTRMISGLPVYMAGDAACITFTGSAITEAVLQLHSFTGAGKTIHPLPTEQAAAMLPRGSTLEMAYFLNADQTLTAGWIQ